MRSYAREVAFCKLYTYLITAEFDKDFSAFDADKLTEEDITFAQSIVEGVINNKQQLDQIVAEFSHAFKLSRVYRLDLAAMEIALYEMIHSDTPHAVAINEAVGLVKRYSTEKSVSYVNGILAAYKRSLA